ncbi:YifB family Mg chelatase-like AAA ATPase [Robbsia andropogonis]|uniref:YifB family Mg chelatase-like AAA ATPase n=1 Tax=Robbsia andropogonis TaxID=28092 RepID=UPI000464A897|nr:YifB family Mg chelatase-like AAA ATPase [Robbsia andropogonis]MCP1117204.1 YifB family Mg chelatase-like AAA ATPase [Robbsia andropogonis]MCP1128550.1 YifB family Mg chelatase-like AAA ATPase [Robbsia andropogonis]
MTIAVVHSRTLTIGMALPVTVEVHLANGLPGCAIVGLPDAEVRESRERVRAALHHCGFTFPPRRITVNLAPADVPKASGGFDLPIALGILVASGQLPESALRNAVFVGELSLNGELRAIQGAFALSCSTVAATRQAMPTPAYAPAQGGDVAPIALYLPLGNAREAAYVPGSVVYGALDLPALCAHLRGERGAQIARTVAGTCHDGHVIDDCCGDGREEGKSRDGNNGSGTATLHCRSKATSPDTSPGTDGLPDLADVIGQAAARRALEVAAAGGHHILMVGPPGAGKSMLAARLPGILPPMSDAEALSSASLLSSAARFDPLRWRLRPFRAPHHSASAAALVGGGNPPRPGEVSLAHNGVLFLDELTEFDRRTLDMLREPLETGHITISRAGKQAHFPAACQLVSAMNPCPCGYAGDPSGRCRCSEAIVQRYQARISGPLLDRIDIRLTLAALTPMELMSGNSAPRHAGTRTSAVERQRPRGECSANVRARVQAARHRQTTRQGCANAMLDARQLAQHCRLDDASRDLLARAMQRFGWSARGHHRVLRLARTIADLDNSDLPTTQHVAEAIQYRKAED